MDYVIAHDIMGYTPFIVPVNKIISKQLGHAKRVVWTNKENERFLFHPSISPEHAQRVVKEMIKQGFEYRMFADNNRWLCSFSKEETYYGLSKSDSEAICLAALKTLGDKK